MKLMYMTIVLLITAQIACQTASVPQAGALRSATETSIPTASLVPPTATSQPEPSCYTITAEEGLHVRSLPKFDSPILGILTPGQGVTVTDQRRDIHGNTWYFMGDGWSRADWMIETECK